MNKLRHAHLLWLLPTCLTVFACGNSDDGGDPNGETDAGAAGSDSSTPGNPGSGSDASSAPDTGTSPATGTDGGASHDSGAHSGGHTPVTSSCAPASVTLGAEVSTPIANETGFDNILGGYFDGDDKLDLVALVNDSGTDSIEVFLGKGDGTFGAPSVTVQDYDSGESGESASVADINGDGFDDLVVGGSDTQEDELILLFLSNGDGTFQAPISTPWGGDRPSLLQVITADFNGDKKLDILYTSEDGNGVILGTGAAFAPSGTTIATTGDWFAVADLNGDGAADIVSAVSGDDGAACVYLNTGSGSFPATGTCLSLSNGLPGIDQVQLADLNKDGKLDIVGTYLGASGVLDGANIDVFLGQGNGAFGTAVPYTLATIMGGVKILDVNNDGYPDYVGYEQDDDAQLDVLLNDGTGKLATTASKYAFGSQSAYAYTPFAAGDFAGNGLTGFAAPSVTGNYVVSIDTIVATCKP